MVYTFDTKKWSEAVHGIRFRMKMGQREFSQHLGFNSHMIIHRWETEKSQPSALDLLYMCNRFGWNPQDFLRTHQVSK